MTMVRCVAVLEDTLSQVRESLLPNFGIQIWQKDKKRGLLGL